MKSVVDSDIAVVKISETKRGDPGADPGDNYICTEFSATPGQPPNDGASSQQAEDVKRSKGRIFNITNFPHSRLRNVYLPNQYDFAVTVPHPACPGDWRGPAAAPPGAGGPGTPGGQDPGGPITPGGPGPGGPITPRGPGGAMRLDPGLPGRTGIAVGGHQASGAPLVVVPSPGTIRFRSLGE
jgi:hypothetical protein